MKKTLFIIIATLFSTMLFSQDLLSKYKSGTVKLVPDDTYAQGNDWNTIFRSFHDSITVSRHTVYVGNRQSLIVLPDGSVIVNHAYQRYHTKFSPNGKFEKEFEIERAGNKAIDGCINGNILFTGLDNMGKMVCSDLEGNYIKTLTLDYMSKGEIVLSNGNIAILGNAIWKKKQRKFVAIVDYETNEGKIIWDKFTDNLDPKDKETYEYSIIEKDGKKWTRWRTANLFNPVKSFHPQIATVDDQLFIALPNTGEVLIYSLDGTFVSKKHINWVAGTMSIEEQKAYHNRILEKMKQERANVVENKERYDQLVSKYEANINNINTPLPKPAFSNVIKDSDGNILFFEIPEERGANIFHVWVYNKNGEFDGKCTFVCDDYELNIRNSKMVFHNGYIYGLQCLKESDDVPLRLVRFKLVSK